MHSWRHLSIKACSLSLIITPALTSRSFWATTWRWEACADFGSGGWEGSVRYLWRCWKASWILILAASNNRSSFKADGPEAAPSVWHAHWGERSFHNLLRMLTRLWSAFSCLKSYCKADTSSRCTVQIETTNVCRKTESSAHSMYCRAGNVGD